MPAPKIKDATVLLAMLEDGELSRDLSAVIAESIAKTREAMGRKESGSCTVTLTIGMKIESDSVEISTDITNKVPKAPRGKTFFFLDQEDNITTEHPRQASMFPQDADERFSRGA